MNSLIEMIVIACLPFGAGLTAAQAGGFDPRQPCHEILTNADENTLAMVGAWTFGYLAAKQSDVRPVDLENIGAILRNITNTCADKKPISLLELVGGSPKAATGKPGSEAQARALLMEFFEPGADLVALTAAILPSGKDVHTVYLDPLASDMVAQYQAALTPGIKFGPKSGQSELLLVYTTTAKLQRGDAVLKEFPGGYGRVLQYFKTDVPIVRFKFVEPDKSSGMAFDGLVYVNDHWVIMPKPWRVLK